MEYNLRISDADIRMEIDPHRENNSLTAVIGEQEYRVSYEAVSENRIYMVVDDGKEKIGMDAYVAQTADGKVIHINGGVCMVSDNDDSSRQQRKKNGAAGLPDRVTPPMPSLVISVLVKTGDTVEKGQGVVVVSAMKMETTLMAPYAGKVRSVNVAEGDKAAPGDILVDIERGERTRIDEAVKSPILLVD
jgi:3-methylcrotonyl-CoA carboxylase alpha subunit